MFLTFNDLRRSSAIAGLARLREQLPAYRSESRLSPTSNTETYVALKLQIDNWRWAGVPFYLRTRKRQPRRTTEIAIQFRRSPFVLFRKTKIADLQTNPLAIHIRGTAAP